VAGDGFRHVDATGHAVRLHERRFIDRVFPDIEREPSIADDAGKCRPAIPARDQAGIDRIAAVARRHPAMDWRSSRQYAEKYRSSRPTRATGSVRSAKSEKSWKSANMMVAERVYFGCTLPVLFSSSATDAGRMLSSSSSARALLGGGFKPRLIEQLDGVIILDQLSAQL
jgi:hypothetical protein